MIADWPLLAYSTGRLRAGACCAVGVRRRWDETGGAPGTRCFGERCCEETIRTVMASNPDPGAGGRAARGAAARKDLDNDHPAATARARWAMIGRGAGIGDVMRGRRINLRYCGGHQLLGTRDVGLASGAGEQPVVADAMKPLW